jgi:Asp/Glu/hydantoin racemase
MRISILNPNTTGAMTDRLMAAAGRVAAPGSTLLPLTATRGVPYISSRAESQIMGAIVLEMLAEHHRDVDAAVIAAFGEPGLHAARELYDIPVVGMAEAAMLTACTLGRRFAIVTFAGPLVAWYEDCVTLHGMDPRCAGVRALPGVPASVVDVQEQRLDDLVALLDRTVEEAGADVLIPGGAPLAGLASLVADRIAVPLVDPIQAAVKMAEGLVALRPRKARTGTFARPPAKPTSGLPAALAARIGHADA